MACMTHTCLAPGCGALWFDNSPGGLCPKNPDHVVAHDYDEPDEPDDYHEDDEPEYDEE